MGSFTTWCDFIVTVLLSSEQSLRELKGLWLKLVGSRNDINRENNSDGVKSEFVARHGIMIGAGSEQGEGKKEEGGRHRGASLQSP